MNKQYGEFSRKGDEFIIHRIDTPKPWVLSLANSLMASILSQSGGGELIEQQSGVPHPITRPSIDSLLPHTPARRLYVRDNDTGDVWSLIGGEKDLRPEHFEAVFAPTHARIQSSQHDIDGAASFFLPTDDPCEVWRVTVRNTSTVKRRISLFAAVEWHTTDGHEFEVRYADSTIIGQSRSGATARRCSFFACDRTTDSFDTREDAFLGRDGSYANPLAVADGRCSRSLGVSPRPVGVLQKNLTLGAGAETELTFLLGAVWGNGKGTSQIRSTAHAHIKRIVHAYRQNQATDNAFTRLTTATEVVIGRNLVKSPDPFFDALTNYWSKHDAATLVASAATPAETVLTSLPAVTANDPETVKATLLAYFAKQSHDGRLVEATSGNEISQLLISATTAYLRETGELSLLEKHVEYSDASSATILHHIIRSLDFAVSHVSKRHLPTVVQAASIETAPQIEQEVLACQIYQNCREILPILDAVGEHELVRRYDRFATLLRDAVNEHFWDGGWYGAAIVDGKKAVGFKKNEAQTARLPSQTSAVIAGITSAERAHKLLATVRGKFLTRYGLVTFVPSYDQPTTDKHSLDAPGSGLNGSIRPEEHADAILMAAIVGDGDEAYRLWQLACPAYLTGKAEQYQAEPFRHSAFIYGPDHPLFGRGKFGPNSAGAKMWLAAVESIVGIRPTLGGLKIDPCLPRDWRQVEATRLFRGAEYHIRIINSFRQSKGVDRILVDGVRITGTVIPAYTAGVHFVEVVLG